MCTAISFKTKDHYFGRNLDLEYSYRETVTVTPRRFPLRFHRLPALEEHFALIGIAYVANDYPLYYDATNEKGLSMAGLNFPENAVWRSYVAGKENVTPYELIPWILGQCATLDEAAEKLANVNALDEAFSENLPLSPLHWLIADAEKSAVIEITEGGLTLCDNPVGVLTNNPPFRFQLQRLCDFMQVSALPAQNLFSEKLTLRAYSRGMGGIGLPGDWSSTSRFVRAAFTKLNSVCGSGEAESVAQFFHVLASVEQVRGSVRLENGKYEITIYSSCCNTRTGVFYYKTYGNSRICAVDMHRENLDGDTLASYPLRREPDIFTENAKSSVKTP